MTKLDFLIRQYGTIMHRRPPRGRKFPVREVVHWLSDDVCPVLHEFALRPTFREHATWSLRSLTAGAETPERALVDEADAALVACAKIMRTTVRLKTVYRQLEAVAPCQLVEKSPARTLVIDGRKALIFCSNRVSRLPEFLSHLDLVASRSWSDLFWEQDYFQPYRFWTTVDDPGIQANFKIQESPELHPGGDLVSRCLVHRVEMLKERLGALYKVLKRVLKKLPRCEIRSLAVATAWAQMTATVARLHQACLQETGQSLRDACMLLTQAYAAFMPEPDVSWLGLPEDVVRDGREAFRSRIETLHNVELADRIAAALSEISGLYANVERNRSSLDEAVANRGLVLRHSPRTLFWQGVEHKVCWNKNRKPWQFLRKLADKCRRGSYVGERDMYDGPVAKSTMANLTNRLKSLIPPTLGREIVCGEEPRTYRLKLEPQQIFFA